MPRGCSPVERGLIVRAGQAISQRNVEGVRGAFQEFKHHVPRLDDDTPYALQVFASAFERLGFNLDGDQEPAELNFDAVNLGGGAAAHE